MIRDLKFEELGKLKEIHAQMSLFPWPELEQPIYCIRKAIEVNGELKGCAFVRITAEVGLIIDPSLGPLTRAKEMQSVFSSLYEDLHKFGLNDVHVFVVPKSDEKFADFLVKNCGFHRTEAIPLERWYE